MLDEILGGGSGSGNTGTGVGASGGGHGAGSAPSDNRPPHPHITSSQVPDRGSAQLTAATAVPAEEELPSTASFAQLDTFSTMFDFDNADLWNFELMDTYGWIEA